MYLIMSHYPKRRTKWLYFHVNLQNVNLVIDTQMKIMYEHINRKQKLYCGFFESLERISEDKKETKKSLDSSW